MYIHIVWELSGIYALWPEALPKYPSAFIGSGAVLCCPTAAAFFDGLKEGLGPAPKSRRDCENLCRSGKLWFFDTFGHFDFSFLYLIVSDTSHLCHFVQHKSIQENIFFTMHIDLSTRLGCLRDHAGLWGLSLSSFKLWNSLSRAWQSHTLIRTHKWKDVVTCLKLQKSV